MFRITSQGLKEEPIPNDRKLNLKEQENYNNPLVFKDLNYAPPVWFSIVSANFEKICECHRLKAV